jgi:hypothetical protein
LIGPSLVEEIALGSLGLHLLKELGRILAKLGKESVDVVISRSASVRENRDMMIVVVFVISERPRPRRD